LNGIAVVVPCYDLGRTLPETLESVRAQTRPAAEVVVVDDGSEDVYTRQVLARLSRSRTCVVRTENRGVAAARNLGVGLTSSPYVVLLDADDVLEPTYLERAAQLLDERPGVGFVTCAMRAFGDADYVWIPPPCTWLQTLVRGGPHVSTMFRRALWEAVGGFDEGLAGYEDTDFWLSAIAHGFGGEVLSDPLLRYRVRASSRYQRAIVRSRYVPTMEAIYRKHWPATAQEGAGLLLEKEAFLAEQRTYRRQLESRRAALEQALGRLRDEVAPAREALAAAGKEALDWGDLRRLSPISPVWGLDRGKPLDRHYIEGFLERHRADIRGRVLEIKDAGYTNRFGGSQVTRSDVLDVDAGNPLATIVADVTRADAIPPDSFDCFILTQTLHIIYDVRAALGHAYRMLKPEGVLLCTLPCVSRISYEDGGLEGGDFWRFTEASVRRLFAEVFPVEAFEVVSYGNLMMCAAFLHGLAPDEVTPGELEETDPWFPLLCAVRAVKPAPVTPRRAGGMGSGAMVSRLGGEGAAILLYHRVGARRPDTHGLCVGTTDFHEHMRHLREHYRLIPLESLVEAAAAASLPPGAVAVTLDDGYLDNLTAVSPILLEFGIPATFFVNTDRLGEEHEFWWDILERVFASEARLPVTLDLYGDGRWIRAVSSAEERAAAHRALIETVFPMAADEREAVIERVARWSGLDLRPRPTHRPMTGEEIQRLAAQPGHSIGAHTIHHLNLPSQPPAARWREVIESKQSLERLLRRRISAFAYPYGQFDKHTVEIVRDAGFEMAVTVEGRLVRPGAERLLLPRFEVKAGDASTFMARLRQIFAAAAGLRARPS
jgi:peptidoglycan/xylan/chitin deacetylase (PgdA/CDA1 family)/GT2 family glycosyltransferase/SAM-dependent methyltransferase